MHISDLRVIIVIIGASWCKQGTLIYGLTFSNEADFVCVTAGVCIWLLSCSFPIRYWSSVKCGSGYTSLTSHADFTILALNAVLNNILI